MWCFISFRNHQHQQLTEDWKRLREAETSNLQPPAFLKITQKWGNLNNKVNTKLINFYDQNCFDLPARFINVANRDGERRVFGLKEHIYFESNQPKLSLYTNYWRLQIFRIFQMLHNQNHNPWLNHSWVLFKIKLNTTKKCKQT